MTNNTWVSIDVESSGLEPGSRILELAAIHFSEDGNVISRFEMLINPGMPLPADAAAVNGIDADLLKDAPDAGVVLRQFLEWLPPEPTFMAHFAAFDCGMLAWEAQRASIDWPYQAPVICTREMAKALGETKDNKLQTLVAHHKIVTVGDAHRAMADADACMKYFLIARKRIEPKSTEWEMSGYDYGYPDKLPEPLTNLPQLIESGTPLSMTYRDAKEQVTDWTILPYGLAQKKDGIYFHGMCALRQERRTFKADRIVSIETA